MRKIKKSLLVLLLLPILVFSQWTQIGEDIDGEEIYDEFGYSVSLSADGNIMATGAVAGIFSLGNVKVFKNQSDSWIQIGKNIEGEENGDQAGSSISLSDDGKIVAIGAPWNDENGSHSGHVRIFHNQSQSWTQMGQDIDGENVDDNFGHSVCLSGDGNTVAIGAIGNDSNGSYSGHVKLYQNQAGSWTQIGQNIDGEAAGDQSGRSLSLSRDGSIVAIGAIYNDGNGDNSGHVRLYQNQSGTWIQLGQDIDGLAALGVSGWSVSLNDDGNIVAVGGFGNNGSGSFSGQVRVFENQSGTWTQIGQIINGESAGDNFGNSVSLSADSKIIAIGGHFNDGNGNNSGHTRIYQFQSGTWTQISQDIDGELIGDQSGWSVSLSGDGSKVASML